MRGLVVKLTLLLDGLLGGHRLGDAVGEEFISARQSLSFSVGREWQAQSE
jgi:hypothetical protein